MRTLLYLDSGVTGSAVLPRINRGKEVFPPYGPSEGFNYLRMFVARRYLPVKRYLGLTFQLLFREALSGEKVDEK